MKWRKVSYRKKPSLSGQKLKSLISVNGQQLLHSLESVDQEYLQAQKANSIWCEAGELSGKYTMNSRTLQPLCISQILGHQTPKNLRGYLKEAFIRNLGPKADLKKKYWKDFHFPIWHIRKIDATVHPNIQVKRLISLLNLSEKCHYDPNNYLQIYRDR